MATAKSEEDSDAADDNPAESTSEPATPLTKPEMSEQPVCRARPRPILCKSHSVEITSESHHTEKRSVSFQLPDSRAPRGRFSSLTRSLKRLKVAAGAALPAKAEKPPPKRILRQPVLHVYLKGASGLPTQRVPLSSVQHQQQQTRRPSLT